MAATLSPEVVSFLSADDSVRTGASVRRFLLEAVKISKKMVYMQIYRHGDLLITPVAEVPKGGRKRPDAILARGEVTGHAHRVESRQAVELWEFENELYFTLGASGGDVVHEEHKAIQLKPGSYKVWRQRQYQPEGNAWIED